MSTPQVTIPEINVEQARAILAAAIPDAMKRCSACGEIKMRCMFTKHKHHSDGLHSRCRVCTRKACRESYQRRKAKDHQAVRAMSILGRYGLSVEEWQQKMEDQGWVCAICGVPPGFARSRHDVEVLEVDHCHKTKEIRGLLCGNCNKGIAMFWDSIELLKSAITYLEHYPDTTYEAMMERNREELEKWLMPTS